MIKECLLMFLFFALGYLIFSLIDELADRFIYKVKRVSIPISAEDYKALKKVFKYKGLKIEKDLKSEVVDYLQVVYLGKESDV